MKPDSIAAGTLSNDAPAVAGRFEPLGENLYRATDAHGHCVFVYDAARRVVQTRRKGVLSEFAMENLSGVVLV